MCHCSCKVNITDYKAQTLTILENWAKPFFFLAKFVKTEIPIAIGTLDCCLIAGGGGGDCQ